LARKTHSLRIEISVDGLAAQAVIVAKAASFHQRESPIYPRQDQDHVAGHLADDGWIVPMGGLSRINRVAIRDPRSFAFHAGLHESNA
jgi:hypothetical protein